jgi:hypothetical protein
MSLIRRWEAFRLGRRLEGIEVPPPLFILGHWRSGTTHLHNLLSLDPGLASPSSFQVFYPHVFLSAERLHARLFGFLLPRTRLIDQVSFAFDVPQEDEFALCILSSRSSYLAFAFPRQWRRYQPYLTLRGLPRGELEEWKRAFLWFARKLTFKHRRPLVFKSPPHTGRIRLLLELFPEARFVHIHRDPYTVFRSMRTMIRAGLPLEQLQRFDYGRLDDLIIENYSLLHEAYFEERGLIPPGRLHEVRYERLEVDPLGEVRRIYERLGLPGFDAAAPRFETYLATLSGYRKNRHAELSEALRQRIASAWRRSFEEWGYPP